MQMIIFQKLSRKRELTIHGEVACEVNSPNLKRINLGTGCVELYKVEEVGRSVHRHWHCPIILLTIFVLPCFEVRLDAIIQCEHPYKYRLL